MKAIVLQNGKCISRELEYHIEDCEEIYILSVFRYLYNIMKTIQCANALGILPIRSLVNIGNCSN